MLIHKIFLGFSVGVAGYFVVWERNVFISPFEHPRENSYVYAHTLLSKVAELHGKKIYLVVGDSEVQLNKYPEIERLPISTGGSGYIFPFLTSMNGYDFSVITLEQYCSFDLNEEHLAFLSPTTLSNLQNEINCYKTGVIELASGYGIDAPKATLESIFEIFRAEFLLSSCFESSNIDFFDLFVKKDNWDFGERPWGVVTQGILISRAKSLSLIINSNNSQRHQGWLVFSDSPSRVSKAINKLTMPLPELTALRNGRTTKLLSKNNTHFVSSDIDSINIEFSEVDYIPAFNGYVLFMHNPRFLQQKRCLN